MGTPLEYNNRMRTLDVEQLAAHRARTFNLPPHAPIASPAQALRYVNERGFIFFWPIKGIVYPSLWTAVAGDRPVPNAHDDPGHVTWRWKDEALGKRQWYYAKVLRGKATLISLEAAPYFYALSENYGSPEEDYLIAYQEGRMTQAARQVYEAILENGPLHTIDLRRLAHLANARDSEFNRALETLQKDFKILPVGVAEAGAWHYAFIYECVARYYPELPEQARGIPESQARERLLDWAFASLGASTQRDLNKLFGWGPELTARVLARAIERGALIEALHPSLPGTWYALPGIAGV